VAPLAQFAGKVTDNTSAAMGTVTPGSSPRRRKGRIALASEKNLVTFIVRYRDIPYLALGSKATYGYQRSGWLFGGSLIVLQIDAVGHLMLRGQ
jgi:hypothetical protein